MKIRDLLRIIDIQRESIIRYKITKPLKIIINRNLPITFSFYKSCDLNENIDKKVIYEELNSLFSSKNNILVSLDNSNIKIHFNERNFSFDYVITFEEYESFDETVEYMLIKQNSTVNFKDVEPFLNNSFWILRDILEQKYIKDNTKKIELIIKSKKFTFFDNTLKVFGNINGEYCNISKVNDVSQISMNIPYNLDSIKKIIEIILLNVNLKYT